MSCGGSMQVFLEPLERPRLLVCGAGHVAAPTARFARDVGFRVTVIDERADLNVPERFPDCRLIVAEPAVAAASLPARADDFVLFLGPSHAHDLSALRAFAQRPHRYLGLMGSLRKVLSIVRTLRAEGLELPLDRLYAPVGVALGATTPQEIAVSIVAELIALRRGETPRHLRALDDPRVRDRFMGG
jgi:xanthine dehydrogenase accessory factor